MGAQLAGDVGRVGRHIRGLLAFLGETRAARIGPHNRWESDSLGGQDQLPQIFVHDVAVVTARIDRVTNGGASQPQGVLHTAGDGAAGLHLAEAVAVVELQDKGQLSRIVRSDGFQKTQRRSVGIAA